MDLAISALEYIDAIREGRFTIEEFVSETITRIGEREPALHAYIDVYEDAVADAKRLDKRMRQGEKVGSCYGLPISIKDNICIKNRKTTCASLMLEGFSPPYDATAIRHLRSQDAIFTGKTNMDEFAMGLTTEFSAYGPSRNPWNTEYVPGGSSGGSAVAVAAHECAASLGSDTGGSVRNPASFCGTVGFKPTYGLVSRYGLVSYANSIEQIGPITKTVSDAAFLLNIISGLDRNDDTTIESHEDYLEGINGGVEGVKIGVVREMIDGADASVARYAKRAVSEMEKRGAEISEVSMDMIKYSVASYYTITAAEAGSNLARYDNIMYGYDMPIDGYEYGVYLKRARARLGPEVKRRMILGGFVPSAGHVGKYFLKALHVKSKLLRDVRAAFGGVDLLASPTVPIQPFKLGSKIDDPVALFLVDINTVTANLCGIPAVSVPFGVEGGLPVGVQLMGREREDKLVLRAAKALEGSADMPEVPT